MTTRMDEKKSDSKAFIFDLTTYLLASARGCIEEPPLYGPLRLIDAASRLATLSEHAGCIENDDFLLAAKKKIDMNKQPVMESEEEFTKFLDGLITEFTAELKEKKRHCLTGWN